MPKSEPSIFLRESLTIQEKTYKAFDVFHDIDKSWCPEMVVIPPGSFLMGSPEDEPMGLDLKALSTRSRLADRLRWAVTL